MTKDEALKMALEALEWSNKEINGWRDDAYSYEPEDQPEIMSAITAIKAALIQPEQEPVAWGLRNMDGVMDCISPQMRSDYDDGYFTIPLYTSPPQRQPLTDDQLDALALDDDGLPNSHFEFARAIEAAHGIRDKT